METLHQDSLGHAGQPLALGSEQARCFSALCPRLENSRGFRTRQRFLGAPSSPWTHQHQHPGPKPTEPCSTAGACLEDVDSCLPGSAWPQLPLMQQSCGMLERSMQSTRSFMLLTRCSRLWRSCSGHGHLGEAETEGGDGPPRCPGPSPAPALEMLPSNIRPCQLEEVLACNGAVPRCHATEPYHSPTQRQAPPQVLAVHSPHRDVSFVGEVLAPAAASHHPQVPVQSALGAALESIQPLLPVRGGGWSPCPFHSSSVNQRPCCR